MWILLYEKEPLRGEYKREGVTVFAIHFAFQNERNSLALFSLLNSPSL
jgi:hypothetical protein